MTKVYNVLFLCTGNSARSILAESILNQEGKGRFKAFSAGSQPKGQVHPLALKTLAALDYPHEGFRSKSWDEFAETGRAANGFRLHRLRQRRRRSLPGLARPADDGALGRRGSRRRRGHRLREGNAPSLRPPASCKNRIMAFLSLPLASIDKLALETQAASRSARWTAPLARDDKVA